MLVLKRFLSGSFLKKVIKNAGRYTIANFGIFLLAFLINFGIFYSFPVIYYLKGNARPAEKKVEHKKLELTQIRKEQKKEKKKKLKVKKVQPQKSSTKARKSRFQMKLGSGGSGVGMASSDMKKIVFKANEVDKEARPMSQTAPDYPTDAENAGITGYADILITVDENGSVTSAKIVEENPQGFGFGDAAAAAVYKWRFRPAEKENIPVRMEYVTRINFGQ